VRIAAFLAAAACIVIGFVVAATGAWLMPPLSWFLAAIAIVHIFGRGE
jgi:hypothetical protein